MLAQWVRFIEQRWSIYVQCFLYYIVFCVIRTTTGEWSRDLSLIPRVVGTLFLHFVSICSKKINMLIKRNDALFNFVPHITSDSF